MIDIKRINTILLYAYVFFWYDLIFGPSVVHAWWSNFKSKCDSLVLREVDLYLEFKCDTLS